MKQTIDISLKVFQDILHEPIGQDVIMRGRHFRTKLMSRNIGSGQNNRFDVRIQELVSKVQNPGPYLRKKRLFWPILFFFPTFVVLRGHKPPKVGHKARFFTQKGPWILSFCSESSHQTGYFGQIQYIGTLILS